MVLGRGAHVRAGGAAAVALAAGHELAAARAVVLGADQGALAAERARAIDRREVRVRGADELTN